MTPNEAALQLVLDGVIEVRADGTVWKLRNLNATRFDGPRRLETTSKRGYLLVRVNAHGKGYMMTAHRLVWAVLRGPLGDGLDINHIDGVKTNNRPENLELVTRAENLRHALSTGLRVPTDVPGDLADEARKLREQGLSYSQIATRLGVSNGTAYRAVQRSKAVAA